MSSSSSTTPPVDPKDDNGSVGKHGAVAGPVDPAPAVRFASNVEEIDPPVPLQGSSQGQDAKATDGTASTTSSSLAAAASDATPEQIQALTNSLRGAKLQEQRIQSFAFEPMSLPCSRVPSNDTSPGATPQQSYSPMGHRSPGMTVGRNDLASPPLTPAGTSAVPESSQKSPAVSVPPSDSAASFDSQAITPQASGQEPKPGLRIELPHRPASTDNISQKTTAVDERDDQTKSHRRSMFTGGLGGQSLPVSRETSPSRSNRASMHYSRPFTPHADANDPYAANKRPAQTRGSNIDQRFVFSRKKKHSPTPSTATSISSKSDKRSSGFFGLGKGADLSPAGTEHGHSSSMANLKRFFKSDPNRSKKSSPAASRAATPNPSSRSLHQVPFADDHGLTSKYGKIGRVLGSGAGGSVKLMRRAEDSTVFAVKEFRPRHSYETEKEYVKKLTAEFCVGSALHHGNIIETLDIVQEKGKWYEVMEYAPYDLFAIVMTGRMSKAEVNCCFLQILSGVTYLHSSGLAHRDLKLDNVVVSEYGIMKIIDFGSAHVFNYPFESELVLANGVVGSDPYLAPEVYEERKYDPSAVDIWSLAIIFCCMSLRRFPWKVPRMTDNSYKLFASEPTPGHDPKQLVLPNRDTSEQNTQEVPAAEVPKQQPPGHSRAESVVSTAPSSQADGSQQQTQQGGQQKEVIRGPWRLLRLLPRESRYIIGRMLTIDPKERAKMAEILDEPWISDTVICRQEGGVVVKAEGHTHILEPPAPVK